jgi:hypothetical protein
MTAFVSKENILTYTGPISFHIKKELIQRFKVSVESNPLLSLNKKKYVYILEELLTNTHEYYKRREIEDEIALDLGFVSGSQLDICISNTILKTDAEETIERLERLNGKKQEEMRLHFQESMQGESNSEHEGGGLGLITVKLKTGNKYVYEIKEKNTTHYLFILATTIYTNP